MKPQIMSLQKNKKIMRRVYEEAFNKGKAAILDEVIAKAFLDHNLGPRQESGLKGIKKFFVETRAAFPDIHVKVDLIVAEGDKVVTRYTATGTHKGELWGIPPTRKRISVAGIDIVRFARGKAVERWGAFDNLGMIQELGVVPPPGKEK